MEKQLKSFQKTCITSTIKTDRKKAHSENMMRRAVKQVALELELWKMWKLVEIPLLLACYAMQIFLSWLTGTKLKLSVSWAY